MKWSDHGTILGIIVSPPPIGAEPRIHHSVAPRSRWSKNFSLRWRSSPVLSHTESH